jgi:hypothetical protein
MRRRRNVQPNRLLSTAFAFGTALLTAVAAAQTPPRNANTDIVKMIQAGLPESVILGKINEGGGRWDASVDALISLKALGATDAELTAIQSPLGHSALPSANLPVKDSKPLMAFGAQVLHNAAGDPYLQFQSSQSEIFPNGLNSNTASLVLYKGEIAVLIPTVAIGDRDCFVSNVLFMRSRLVIDQYLYGACNLMAGPTQGPLRNGIYEYPRTGLVVEHAKHVGNLSTAQERVLGLNTDKLVYMEGKRKTLNAYVVFGVFPFRFDSSPATAMRAPLLASFVDSLSNDFDKTVDELLRVAGTPHPDSQLSARATYAPVSEAESRQYKTILEQRWKEDSQNGQSHGGGGWLTALNALQGVVNIQQAIQDAKLADASHNAITQVSAAVNLGKTEIDAIGSVSNPTAALQPKTSIFTTGPPTTAAPPQGDIQTALNQKLAGINAVAATSQQAHPAQSATNIVAQPTGQLPSTASMRGSSSPKPAPSSSGTPGRCPGGGYTGGTFVGMPCDCRSNSAAYNCPNAGNHAESNVNSTPTSASNLSKVDANPTRTATPNVPSQVSESHVPVVTPSYSTVDAHGNVSLGTGPPKACAVSPDGSLFPLVPGTSAPTCWPASCRNTNLSMKFESHWMDAKKAEVVGFISNNSLGDATCTWAFHKHGIWTEPGQMVVQAGKQHQGGEFGGVWSVETDSSDIQYVCFEGIDPVDVHGKLCNQEVVFIGPTTAGTDK